MEKSEILKLLESNPLFFGTDPSNLEKTVSAALVKEHKKGEELFSSEPSLYYLARGKAQVKRVSGSRSVVINTLSSGNVFGAAQLFGGDGRVTSVTAACRCVCIVIPAYAVEEFLRSDFAFARNYITFLSDKIRFLNRKIASYTAGDGEKTLAAYLLTLPGKDGEVRNTPKMSAIAASLNMSRPTLYRAFTSLEDRGLIEKKGTSVRIISSSKLKSLQGEK